ncbi:MAG: hypothetical protein ACXWNI_00325 [Candidatus Limnocylindrales bacterium]
MTATEASPRAATTLDEAALEESGEITDEGHSVTDRARVAVMGALEHMPGFFGTARSGASQVAEHLPDAVDRARAGAHETTAAMQTVSDPTLRLLAAGSIGLAVGLYLAGARRPITLAAMVPAVIAGSAIATRPSRIRLPSR